MAEQLELFPFNSPARKLVAHYDGYGLNEDILVEADARDPHAGNASHIYSMSMPDGDKQRLVARIDFQHGPRQEKDSTPGILDSTLLTVIIDRYEGFQTGPFACDENQRVLDALHTALAHMVKRANARYVQKVLGKNIAHRS